MNKRKCKDCKFHKYAFKEKKGSKGCVSKRALKVFGIWMNDNSIWKNTPEYFGCVFWSSK